MTERDRVDNSSQIEIDGWIVAAKRGDLSWSQLAERLLALEHPSRNSHQPDTDRARRCGFGEVIFGSNKTPESITRIASQLLASGQREVLVTRVLPEQAYVQYSHFASCRYDSVGRTLRLSNSPISVVQALPSPAPLPIAVVTAGSTDLPVAREALETLRWMGVDADLLCDVGVAGPYRLLGHLERLRKCAALVAVAGMEGALASVVGGLVPCPVIAVPTSIGYGANLEGITTLLSMMSSCAAGVTVVNIDAGFKGGYIAGLIAHRAGLKLEG
ncbi:MAG: nickel pincer cofactor biosynthesis protein LarB [Pirellulaceae bacterium]|nr:nickel pincer cofactor biosynthesis protein LarB [Pirellulaceae bacterium]